MPGSSYRGPLPAADDSLNRLAADLRRHVVALAGEIGERNVVRRPAAMVRAAQYIEAEFVACGLDVERQTYDVLGTTCCNLIAEIPGTTRPAEIVVVGAHYDAVFGSPAANDNGTGVAAVLSLAKQFAKRPGARTLRLVAFANEEPPFFQTDKMGSLVYARRCRQRQENIAAMLSIETIGYFSDERGSQKYPPPFGVLYPSTGNFIAFVSNVRSGSLVRRAVATFRRSEPFPSEGAAVPDAIPGIGFSDHWSFWQAGYPAIMVTDTAPFRYPHYHEPDDTPDKVDFDKTARVVRGLRKVIEELVGSSSGRQNGTTQ
ncbi:MAG: M28 family peptidase [Planctomycetes bacterium]|nr:M28 family peptidase [Planctomycetota bacterium]